MRSIERLLDKNYKNVHQVKPEAIIEEYERLETT
jgi:hypothetical protein